MEHLIRVTVLLQKFLGYYDVENTEIKVSNEYEYALMLQDILKAAKEAKVPGADIYYEELEIVKLCDSSLNVNDFCKDVIKTEEKRGSALPLTKMLFGLTVKI